ncbi:MAG: flagella basal body P-ring formation protein FlgA [Bdellovibrio sp. 28-41-41]|nr:MAG: flagella basal body P-ring formation protein FlgA [Bdellovibrio sp. 28-41-41]
MNRFLFLILVMPFLLQAQTEVSLLADVEVSTKTEYTLYDLVSLKQGTSEDLDGLKKISVPFLNKKAILEALKDSGLKTKVIFENTFKITVTNQINRNELQRKITNHLTAQCNECIFEIQTYKLPFVNEPNMNFRDSDFELTRGSFMLPLWGATKANKSYATGSWRTFKKVALTNKWMSQGQRFRTEDLKEELKEVTFLNNKLIDIKDLVGKQLMRSTPANTIVTRDILVIEKMVKKGDIVSLMVNDGPFEIEIKAQAESDGQEGDSIKVKANQKTIMAKVVSKDKVVSE